MKRLYLETNYVVGQAFSQDPIASTIIGSAARVGAEICLPSICIFESLVTVPLRQKSAKKFEQTIQDKVNELRDDSSSTSVALKRVLSAIILDNAKLRDERQARMNSVIASLSAMRILDLDHKTTTMALSASTMPDAADNLILHVICEDAQRNPVDDMAFLTLNADDFAKADPRIALRAASVRLLLNSSEVVTWLS